MTVETVNLLRAQLHHIGIESSNPEKLAEFYARALRLEFTRDGDRFVGTGPRRASSAPNTVICVLTGTISLGARRPPACAAAIPHSPACRRSSRRRRAG